MRNEQRIFEAIDACRPNSADLNDRALADVAAQVEADPALAAVYRKVQAIDAQLTEAMADVPVPAGLAARLTARLEAAGGEGSSQQATSSVVEPVAPASLLRGRALASRRVFLALGSMAVAAALLLAASVWLLPRKSEPLALELLQHKLALEWHEQVWQDAAWRGEPLPDAKRPPSSYVVGYPQAWRPLASPYDSQATAYDLTPPGSRQRATLFVLRATATDAGRVPPTRPFFTLGRSVAVWQEQDLLYVLVVEGDPSRYHRLIRTQSGPLA